MGLGLLYLAFRDINFGKLLAIYSHVDQRVIIPVFFVTLLELFFRGLRWKLLLDPAGRVRFRDAFRLESAALALSNILPLRLGEAARGTFGAGLFGIPVMTVFATILVERALDLVTLVILFMIAARLGGLTGGFLNYGAFFWPLLGIFLFGLLALIFIDEIMAHRQLSGLFAKFPRTSRLLGQLALGARAFRSLKTAAAITALGVLQWLMDALNLYILAWAFSLTGIVGAYKAVALLFTGAVAVSLPGMPGYFGNFEFALAGILGSWGVNKDVAFAYAAFGHVLSYLIFTTLGLVFVYQMGQSLGSVWARFSGKAAATPSRI